MATLSEQQIIGIVTLGLILSGAVIVLNLKESYYCKSEDNVKECIRISSSNVTCYTIISYDRCTGGTWEPLENYIIDAKNKDIFLIKESRGIWYTRDPDGTTCYEFGNLRRAVKCP